MALESAGTDYYNFWNSLLNRLTKPHLNCLRDQSFEELLVDFFLAINFPYLSITHVLYLKWSQKLPFNLKVMNTTNSLQVTTSEVGCTLLGLMVIFVAFWGNIFVFFCIKVLEGKPQKYNIFTSCCGLGVLWHDNFLHHFLHVHYFGLYCTTWPYFDALKALDAKFK